MQGLDHIIERLKSQDNIDAVFLTGSQGTDHKPYSDIDLVVILKKHGFDLTSLYTWIDGTFADIFFFDLGDLERICSSTELAGNSMDGVFVDWLAKGGICFDKSGALTKLAAIIAELQTRLIVPASEKDHFWQKINYNFVANSRYFNSGDPLYHEALELRLFYSVSQVISGYFVFRDIPWRGEKAAVKYIKEYDSAFYTAFRTYTEGGADMAAKFEAYSKMVRSVFQSGYELWTTDGIFPEAKDRVHADVKNLVEYWRDLIK